MNRSFGFLSLFAEKQYLNHYLPVRSCTQCKFDDSMFNPVQSNSKERDQPMFTFRIIFPLKLLICNRGSVQRLGISQPSTSGAESKRSRHICLVWFALLTTFPIRLQEIGVVRTSSISHHMCFRILTPCGINHRRRRRHRHMLGVNIWRFLLINLRKQSIVVLLDQGFCFSFLGPPLTRRRIDCANLYVCGTSLW